MFYKVSQLDCRVIKFISIFHAASEYNQGLLFANIRYRHNTHDTREERNKLSQKDCTGITEGNPVPVFIYCFDISFDTHTAGAAVYDG